MKLLKTLLIVLLLPCVSVMPVAAGDDADPGDIVINEIMKDTDQILDASGEWFEVYNTTGLPVDMEGWTIQSGSETHPISGTLNVGPGSYVVLCRNGNSSANGGVSCDYSYGSSISLNNDYTDNIILQEDAGTQQIIASVTYSDTFWPDPEGASMVYIPSATPPLSGYFMDNNDPSRWGTSTSPYGTGNLGTPGSQNDQGGVPIVTVAETVEPGVEGMIVFTNTQGLTTTIYIPAGAFGETTSITYTELTKLQQSTSGFQFAGRAFDLRASSTLVGSLTISLGYPSDGELETMGIDEATLRLYYWAGSTWEDVANTCTPASTYTQDPSANVLSVTTCHLTSFGLLGEKVGMLIYLPLVLRDHR